MNSNVSKTQIIGALVLCCFGFLGNPNLELASMTDLTDTQPDSSISGFLHKGNSDNLSDADAAYVEALREHTKYLA